MKSQEMKRQMWKPNVGRHLLFLPPQLHFHLSLGRLPGFQGCSLLLALSLQPGAPSSSYSSELSEQIPLYFCLQGGAVGVVLSHDHSLFLMKKRVLAFQSSSWSNGQNFHNKLFFLSCANFHIHSSLDSIYLIRKLRSKINYLCSSKPESCHPSGTSGFQRLF